MSVLKLKDKEIKGFQVHFEDEHWREDFGDSFGGGGWEPEITSIRWKYIDDLEFSVKFIGRQYIESTESYITIKESHFINWLLINLEEIKSMEAYKFEKTVENLTNEESFIKSIESSK